MGVKAQTLETTEEDDLERILGVFEGWKHPRACSWRDF